MSNNSPELLGKLWPNQVTSNLFVGAFSWFLLASWTTFCHLLKWLKLIGLLSLRKQYECMCQYDFPVRRLEDDKERFHTNKKERSTISTMEKQFPFSHNYNVISFWAWECRSTTFKIFVLLTWMRTMTLLMMFVVVVVVGWSWLIKLQLQFIDAFSTCFCQNRRPPPPFCHFISPLSDKKRSLFVVCSLICSFVLSPTASVVQLRSGV